MRILATGDRLEVLIMAVIEVALDHFQVTPLGNCFAAQERALRRSVTWLVKQLELNETSDAADDSAATAAKHAQTTDVRFQASAINVKRRDSTVLLIGGRPFYVFGPLIELKSAVLADALSSTETLDPIPLPLPNEVPEEQQYALFHAAVEHAYTGTIGTPVAAESLLPLWCLADHLQMDGLCTWCVERLTPVLKQDEELLELTWTSALARPSDALCDACATAWLVTVSKTDLDERSIMLLLKRVHEGCADKELVAAQLVRVLRQGLLARIAKTEADPAQ